MRTLTSLTLMVLICLTPSSGLLAHHNTQTEYGSFSSSTTNLEGTIVRIIWGNPHIAFEVETTGGEMPAGEKWRLESHPIRIQIDYGFEMTDFAVGDSVKVIGWKHLQNAPMMWPRAIQVNDGPMRSNLRYTDMIDIANGEFEEMNMLASGNLNGSGPGRAESAAPGTTEKLREMGLLDADGLMIWPPSE